MDCSKYYEQINGTALQKEVDYTFPDTWEVVRSAHICRLMDGEKKEGKHICLDAKYLRGKSSGDILTKGKFVSTGNNIILVDGENSGEIFTTTIEGYQGSTLKILNISQEVNEQFIFYILRKEQKLFKESKTGSAIPHLNKKIFKELIVFLPPLAEQCRIVKKIETYFAAFDKIKNELI